MLLVQALSAGNLCGRGDAIEQPEQPYKAKVCPDPPPRPTDSQDATSLVANVGGPASLPKRLETKTQLKVQVGRTVIQHRATSKYIIHLASCSTADRSFYFHIALHIRYK